MPGAFARTWPGCPGSDPCLGSPREEDLQAIAAHATRFGPNEKRVNSTSTKGRRQAKATMPGLRQRCIRRTNPAGAGRARCGYRESPLLPARKSFRPTDGRCLGPDGLPVPAASTRRSPCASTGRGVPRPAGRSELERGLVPHNGHAFGCPDFDRPGLPSPILQVAGFDLPQVSLAPERAPRRCHELILLRMETPEEFHVAPDQGADPGLSPVHESNQSLASWSTRPRRRVDLRGRACTGGSPASKVLGGQSRHCARRRAAGTSIAQSWGPRTVERAASLRQCAIRPSRLRGPPLP